MAEHFFHTVQIIAGGTGTTLALANGFWNPTTIQNWVVALIGAMMGFALAFLSRRKNA